MKTALIVHGYGLGQSDWEYTMWGDVGRGLLGRIPTALLLIDRRHPDLIIWNTGSTEKDGMREGDYILQHTLTNLGKLPFLHKELQRIDPLWLKDDIRKVSITETYSKRTSESLEIALPLLIKRGKPIFDEVMQVTSKNHASRVLRDSLSIWWEKHQAMIMTSIYPAQTGYAGGTAGEVQITELVSDKRVPFDTERVAALIK